MLTKTTETVLVPTTKTTYSCDVTGCGFTAPEKRLVVEHHGEKHAVDDRRWVGEQEFCLLETREAFDAWKTYRGRRDRANVWDCDWLGPGWYGISFGKQRCPRNCCDDCVMTIRHVEVVLEERRVEVAEMTEGLAELGRLVEETSDGSR